MLSVKFRHTPWLAVLHPVSVAVMTVIQWHSFLKHLRGTRTWRGRTMGADAEAGSDAPAIGTGPRRARG
jgi:hypothetical protein